MDDGANYMASAPSDACGIMFMDNEQLRTGRGTVVRCGPDQCIGAVLARCDSRTMAVGLKGDRT